MNILEVHTQPRVIWSPRQKDSGGSPLQCPPKEPLCCPGFFLLSTLLSAQKERVQAVCRNGLSPILCFSTQDSKVKTSYNPTFSAIRFQQLFQEETYLLPPGPLGMFASPKTLAPTSRSILVVVTKSGTLYCSRPIAIQLYVYYATL